MAINSEEIPISSEEMRINSEEMPISSEEIRENQRKIKRRHQSLIPSSKQLQILQPKTHEKSNSKVEGSRLSALIFLCRKPEKFVLDGETHLTFVDVDVLRHDNLDELSGDFHPVTRVKFHEVLHHQRTVVALWCGVVGFKPFLNHAPCKPRYLVWRSFLPAASFFADCHTSVKR